jgi:hypothetical protein
MVCICQSVYHDWYLSECLPWLVFLRVSSMVCICQSVFHDWYLSECLLWFVFVRVNHRRHWQIPIMQDILTNTNHRRHSDKYQSRKTLLTNKNHRRHSEKMSCIIGICQSVFYGLYFSECLPWLVFVRVSSMVCICQSVYHDWYLSECLA